MHPAVENETPFAFEAVPVADEHGRPVVVTQVKATFDMHVDGRLSIADEQRPVAPAGEWWGAPGESSMRYEPEIALAKPSTDIVLVGHAHAPASGVGRLEVQLSVGPVERHVRVSGERTWQKRLFSARISDPTPFEKIPLCWERAFGGTDPDSPEDKPASEARNPLGVGYRRRRAAFEEGAPLPNLEDPRDLLEGFHSRVRPAGFGFLAPNWEPRRGFTGTYDRRWEATRSPLLPEDFDRRFFQAAPPELVPREPLRGDEKVRVVHATPTGPLETTLPGLAPPSCTVAFRTGRPDEQPALVLDTVIVDTDDMHLVLIWRGLVTLHTGPLDVGDYLVQHDPAAVSPGSALTALAS